MIANAKTYKLHKIVSKTAIVLTATIAVLVFAAAFFRLPALEFSIFNNIAGGRVILRLGAILLLVVVWNLYLRKRVSWVIALAYLIVNLASHYGMEQGALGTVIMILELFAIVTLLYCRDDFNLRSDMPSARKAVLISCIAMGIVFLNAAFSYYHFTRNTDIPVSFGESLGATVALVFGGAADTGLPQAAEIIIICSFWICFAISLLYVLRAAFHAGGASKQDRERARKIVQKWGQNTASYLTLEKDKTLFFGNRVDGYVSYGVAGKVKVVFGDPVCDPADFPALLDEFDTSCSEGGYEFVFLGVTPMFMEEYKSRGYGYVKCGVESMFDLKEYDLTGRKMSRMRSDINHSRNAGLETHEYKLLAGRDSKLEKEIQAVSDAWLAGKKGEELSFVMGGISLDDPGDRRYFYATDPAGQLVAFNVFLPFGGMDGYIADITRRRQDAPGGVTEMIMYDAFQVFKAEGIRWGSMGLCPLAEIAEEGEKDTAAQKLLDFIYEKCNSFYGFKNLYIAKKRYSPSGWQPMYIVHSTKRFMPQMCHAILKLMIPEGVGSYIKESFKRTQDTGRKANDTIEV